MSDERTTEKTKQKVENIEKTVIAILKAIKAIEEEIDEPVMPTGEYLGVKFDE